MLNYLWGGMIVAGIIFGVFSGKMPDITNGALDSAKEAVDLCVMMIGIMSMWVGIMEIATKSGMIDIIAKKIRPLIHILFPGVPKGHLAEKYITTNMVANFLGLGWAATPAGIMAMKYLQELNPNRDKRIASCDMCTFLIINISSLQLIPINVIAYRSQYGSVNPTKIIGAGIMATTISTIAGIVFALVMAKKTKNV
ncbi:nucleoside recognition protein [Faecalimonas sp.]